MSSSFVGFCFVCSDDTIFRKEHLDDMFSCDRCSNAVRIAALEETRLRDVAAV